MTITQAIAYEAIKNYCDENYFSNATEDERSMMYVDIGDETEIEYKIIFRSYTGSFIYFYVNKLTGIARVVDFVPLLDIEEESGTINIRDYIK